MGILDGFISLAQGINKFQEGKDDTQQEGVIDSSISSVISLDIEDSELVQISKDWESRWEKSESRKELERKQKENEKYWLGDHSTPAQKQSGLRELTDNLIFEALETALPAYNRKIADPNVTSDNTPEGRVLAKKVQDRIVDIADTVRLRLKVKKATRHWALYYLGCIKLGWSTKNNEIAVEVKRPQQLILDPDAITDECEYTGDFLGEYKSETAQDLIARFPEKKEFITQEVSQKLGTKLRYIEFWTNDIIFWRLKGAILGKSKNPHWNYDIEETQETGELDQEGSPTTQNVVTEEGRNHFASRKIPYAFLSVFNLGKHPFDDTNQIEQVLCLQDVINKRQKQIDRNADSMNAGAVVSGDAFSKEQGKQVADALRKGLTVWVPKGNVNSSYKRDAGVALPSFVQESLSDFRNELRNIFGTTGLSAQGLKSTETVRGKILVRETDAQRNPLVDHLEQFYDYIFNWMVQLMMVYYDEPRNVSKTQGDTLIVNSEFVHPLVVSVKEGSLIPHDQLTTANQSVDLALAGKMSLIDLYKNLDYPNPEELAANVWLETNAPEMLYPNDPRVAQVAQSIALAKAAEARQIPNGRTEENPKGDLLDQVPIQ